MNRKDIMHLCTQAVNEKGVDGLLFRFAKLVAAAEREACAVLVERGMGDWPNYPLGDWLLGKKVAKAIRARGQE